MSSTKELNYKIVSESEKAFQIEVDSYSEVSEKNGKFATKTFKWWMPKSIIDRNLVDWFMKTKMNEYYSYCKENSIKTSIWTIGTPPVLNETKKFIGLNYAKILSDRINLVFLGFYFERVLGPIGKGQMCPINNMCIRSIDGDTRMISSAIGGLPGLTVERSLGEEAIIYEIEFLGKKVHIPSRLSFDELYAEIERYNNNVLNGLTMGQYQSDFYNSISNEDKKHTANSLVVSDIELSGSLFGKKNISINPFSPQDKLLKLDTLKVKFNPGELMNKYAKYTTIYTK